MTIFDVVVISQKILFLGVLSGNINPPGGLLETRPWFLESRISLKNQVLKSIRWISFRLFLTMNSKFLSSALTCRCGSDGNGPGIYCWELSKDMWLLLDPPPPPWNIEKITRELMFLMFCKARSRETRGESILELFPPLPPTRIP